MSASGWNVAAICCNKQPKISGHWYPPCGSAYPWLLPSALFSSLSSSVREMGDCRRDIIVSRLWEGVTYGTQFPDGEATLWLCAQWEWEWFDEHPASLRC